MNVAEACYSPVAQIAYQVAKIKGGRWQNFLWGSHRLEWKWLENGIEYWLPPQPGVPNANGNDARIVITNITFNNTENLVLSEPEILKSEVQDAYSIISDNTDGTSPLGWDYETTFEETGSESDSFTAGLETSVRTWFGSGEQQPVSTGVELTVSAKAEWSKSHGVEKTASRKLDVNGQTDPGIKEKIWGTRTLTEKKRVARGKAQLEFHIWIGSFSYWAGIPGASIQVWDWQYEWGSFSDFLHVLKGESYGALSDEFRAHPPPPHEIVEFEERPGNEVEIPYIFHDSTDATIKREVIS